MKTKFFLTAVIVAAFGILNVQAQDKTHADHDHEKMEKMEAVHACPMKCEGEKTYAKAGDCPKCGMALTKQEVEAESKVFYCPMKCEGDKTYAKNEGCPKCGMALVEKKADTKKKDSQKEDHSGHKH